MARRAGSALLAVGIVSLLGGCGGDAEPAAACGEVQALVETTFNHVLPGPDVDPAYSWSPPTSGTHLSAPPPGPGVHEVAIAPVEQVTALEAGTLIVQYDATVSSVEVADLVALAGGRGDLIVAPVGAPIDEGQHVAATAWGRRLLCDGVALEPIEAFLDANTDVVDAHG